MSLIKQLWLTIVVLLSLAFVGSLFVGVSSSRHYIEQEVRIKNADKINIVKIEALYHHLCSHQNINPPLFELLYQYIMSIFSPYCIHIHSCNFSIRKNFFELLFNFFSTEISLNKIVIAAYKTCVQGWICGAAIMTDQFIGEFVIG